MKKLIVILFIIFGSFLTFSLYKTFAYDTSVVEEVPSTTDLEYTFKIGNSSIKQITVDSGETRYYDIVLGNPNNAKISYSVYYEMVSPSTKPDGYKIEYTSKSTGNSTGIVNNNGNITLNIVVTNTSSSSVTVKVGTVAGYVKGGELTLNSGQEVIPKRLTAAEYVMTLNDNTSGDEGSGVYKIEHSAIPASNSATGSEIPAVTDYRYYGPNPNNYILLPDMNTTESRCMFNDKELLNLSMGEWPANFDCENEVVYKLDTGLGVNLYIPTSTFEIVAPAGSMTYNETYDDCLYNGSSIGSMYRVSVDENICKQMSVINISQQGNYGALITKMNDKPHNLNVKNGLYRIIGSIYDERSKTNRLKVIKATPLTDGTTSLYSWDVDINNNSSQNIWATPTSGNFSNSLTSGASIMKLLNSGAWWNGTSGTYDNYYADKYNAEIINTNFTNYKLSDKAKSSIDISRYYLGGIDASEKYTKDVYIDERGTGRYDENRPLYWDGMVGLMYPSDYGYAAGNVCTTEMILWQYVGECPNKDWLYNTGVNQWLMSPYACNSTKVHSVDYNGNVVNFNDGTVGVAFAVSPVFYLTPSASITSGTGTLTDPYILG